MADGFRDWIDGLDAAELELFAATMPLEEARAADGDWKSWAHDGQLAPDGNWSTWVLMAGRGFGKTRAGAEWVTAAIAGASGCASPWSARRWRMPAGSWWREKAA